VVRAHHHAQEKDDQGRDGVQRNLIRLRGAKAFISTMGARASGSEEEEAGVQEISNPLGLDKHTALDRVSPGPTASRATGYGVIPALHRRT
jgi:hypothetical protein